MTTESELIEKNLQAIEAAVLTIAKDLNWFTPTQIKDIPDKPGWKRIEPTPTVLPDAKEHQMHIDSGLGFAIANVCYNKKERVLGVFLKAMKHVGLKAESYEAFSQEFSNLCENFNFETDEESKE